MKNLILALLFSLALSIDAATPNVLVLVSDFTDDYVPQNRMVTLAPTTAGTLQRAVSDSDGQVAFSSVAPGIYNLTIADVGVPSLSVRVPNQSGTISLITNVLSEWTAPGPSRQMPAEFAKLFRGVPTRFPSTNGLSGQAWLNDGTGQLHWGSAGFSGILEGDLFTSPYSGQFDGSDINEREHWARYYFLSITASNPEPTHVSMVVGHLDDGDDYSEYSYMEVLSDTDNHRMTADWWSGNGSDYGFSYIVLTPTTADLELGLSGNNGQPFFKVDETKGIQLSTGGMGGITFHADLNGNLTLGGTLSAATNSANFTITTNNFALDTYYTNAAQRAWVAATLSLTNSGAGNLSQVSLFIDQDADGSWERTGTTARLQGVANLSGNQELSAFLQPGARFLFTNQTSGGAAAVVPNSSQWVKQ